MSESTILRGILDDVIAERERQDAKFGWPRPHGLERWFVILGEEIGEADRALASWPSCWLRRSAKSLDLARSMVKNACSSSPCWR